jgi:N-acetylglucosaminyldiphosphoundecaprenol N-acetyl-beta-D-mannosaminyltransferase
MYVPLWLEDLMERGNIVGVGISAVNMAMAVGVIEKWIENQEQNYVLNIPAHLIVDCQRDPVLRRICNGAGLANPDGMPVAWILRLMGFRQVDRVCGPDLMLAMCRRSLERGYKHFLYGGWPPAVTVRLAAKLRERFPGLRIVGEHTPPFRPLTPEEDRVEIETINAADPDIVWCGLGARKEEYWTSGHIGKVNAPVLIGVGAAFDFHSGTKKQAPRWMMRAGLEWFFRLLTEPRRLWRRYLLGNPEFLALILRQALGKMPPSLNAD